MPGERTALSEVPGQRLGTAGRRVRRPSDETDIEEEEEEERREQMDPVGRFGGFDAICGGVRLSDMTWQTRPGAPMSAPYFSWI
jgi:hypothetical protein